MGSAQLCQVTPQALVHMLLQRRLLLREIRHDVLDGRCDEVIPLQHPDGHPVLLIRSGCSLQVALLLEQVVTVTGCVLGVKVFECRLEVQKDALLLLKLHSEGLA